MRYDIFYWKLYQAFVQRFEAYIRVYGKNTLELPINYETAHWTIRKKAREQYIKNQGGLCCYCGSSLEGEPNNKLRDVPIIKELFPIGFFDWPVHLHHSHSTGLTIGTVHALCNAVLWQYHGE